MADIEIVKFPDEKLKTQSVDFDFDKEDPKEWHEMLVSSCQQFNGLGLSAIQLGEPIRAFTMLVNDERRFKTIFNPEIITQSERITWDLEGCLSFPGVFLKKERPLYIEAKYTDVDNVEQTETFSGIFARIFLHECEHLDGVVLKDGVKPLAWRLVTDRAKKDLKKMARYEKSQQYRAPARKKTKLRGRKHG